MRIVHVTDAYLPKRGGIEVQVHDLAHRQRAAGHDACVVTRALGAQGGDVPVLRAGEGHGPVAWRRAASRIAQAVADSDQVHAHLSVFSPAALVGLRAATRAGVPAVATYHSAGRLPAHSARGGTSRSAGTSGSDGSRRSWPGVGPADGGHVEGVGGLQEREGHLVVGEGQDVGAQAQRLGYGQGDL